jgi:hypothetical protein
MYTHAHTCALSAYTCIHLKNTIHEHVFICSCVQHLSIHMCICMQYIQFTHIRTHTHSSRSWRARPTSFPIGLIRRCVRLLPKRYIYVCVWPYSHLFLCVCVSVCVCVCVCSHIPLFLYLITHLATLGHSTQTHTKLFCILHHTTLHTRPHTTLH